MRFVACVFLIACDLQPPPKKLPAPPAASSESGDAGVVAPPDAEPVTMGDASAPQPPPADAAAPPTVPSDAAVAISRDCMRVAQHVAEVSIASTTDAALRAEYEKTRALTERTIGEVCTIAGWDARARDCLLKIKTVEDVEKCRALLPGARPPQ